MKKVVLVRHAESEFNAALGGDESKRFTEKIQGLVDCGITENGIKKCNECQGCVEVDFLVVSPLKRAMQTAVLMFPSVVDGSLKHEVQPLAAEHLLDICDVGSTRDALQSVFPWANLNLVPTTPWWHAKMSAEQTWPLLPKNDPFEPEEIFAMRITQLKEYLKSLPYERVGLVCHSHVIFEMTKHEKEGETFGKWADNNECVEVCLE
eukprot:TRINITY_DN2875_c0_g2_i1.p1 TRINITY_DN2875_c0_g2~~TRINITY_DN2875_c0_g2_i1.p1  ORF type:complete len:207 (+),score=42.17 TRINITY_DN2875_c0_g2_i1:38-658(+)